MNTTGTATGRNAASRDDTAREITTRMAASAAAWLDALDPAQRAAATGGAPSPDAEPDAELDISNSFANLGIIRMSRADGI